MLKKILWLDNDKAWTNEFVEEMEEAGYAVDVVTMVTEAENLIMEDPNPYNLY